MAVVEVFGVIATIIILGFLAEIVFKKTGIPDVLFLIFTGILIGTVLQWVSPETFGSGSTLFTTFALIFILFQGALSMDVKALFASLSESLSLTFVSFVVTVAVVTTLAYALGFDFLVSLLIGMMLGGTSGAVVIPLVKNIKIGERHGLVLMLESALSDVLSIVGAITVIDVFQTGNVVASGVFKTVLSSFAMALVVGGAIGVVWILMMNRFELLSKSYMMTIAVLVGLYAFVESPFVEASGAIAALSFGLILGNAQPLLRLMKLKKHGLPDVRTELPLVRDVLSLSAKSFYSQIGFFVKVFFFVYLGILMDFSVPIMFLYGGLLTLGIYFLRPLAVRSVFRKKKLDAKTRTFLEVLIPKGLAAAVLAQLAVQAEIPRAGALVNIVLAVVLVSILLTSVLVFFTERGWFAGLWNMFSPAPKPVKEK